MRHQSVDLQVRLQGLDKSFDRLVEKSFKVDENFIFVDVCFSFVTAIRSDRSNSSAFIREAVDRILSIFENASIEFHEVTDGVEANETDENKPFIVDPLNFTVTWDPTLESYLVKNQGKLVINLSPEKKYKMIIKPRSKINIS